jgi:hypothetical protein
MGAAGITQTTALCRARGARMPRRRHRSRPHVLVESGLPPDVLAASYSALMLFVAAFIFGTLVGSFLNVCIPSAADR